MCLDVRWTMAHRARTDTIPIKNPCGRCGIGTTADYCADCKSVDPVMCADGRDPETRRIERVTHNAWAREFWADMYRVSGISYTPPAVRKERDRIRQETRAAQNT